MHKLWTLFCLGLVFASVYSQTCGDTTSLRAYYGFSSPLPATSTGATQTGVNFCTDIQNGPVCCTVSDMNSFQTKSDAIIAALTTQAGARDTSFATTGTTPSAAAASVATSVAAFTTALTASGKNISSLVAIANASGSIPSTYAGFGSFSTNVNPVNTISPSAPNGIGGSSTPAKTGNGTRLLQSVVNNSASTSVSVYGLLANLQNIQSQLANASNAVTNSLTDYQSSRSACVVAIYQVQASAWCLSCDPNATLKGYDSSGTLIMDPTVCTRLKTACYPYLVNAGLQNSAFNQQMLIASLNFAATAISAGGNPLNQTFTYTGQQPASFPPGCTSVQNCTWICTTLFNAGAVNNPDLINGGVVASTSSRLLFEVKVAPEVELSAMRPRQLTDRQLVSGTWAPSPTEAGVTVAFAADPAGISSSNNNTPAKSGMLTYGSILGGMIAMIWSMMM